MAQKWKTISQRKWQRGLQATFSIFSEPEGLLKRLTNMVYDRRGGLRTVDGSLIFTERSGSLQPDDGPILELALYAPNPDNRYYLGIQKSFVSTLGPIIGLTVTPVQVGGAILSIARVSGVTTITLDHTVYPTGANLSASNLAGNGTIFATGSLTISGTVAFNRTIDASAITQAVDGSGNYTYTYNDAGADATETAGNFLPTNPLAPGNYTYDVTASDALGGESTGTGAPVVVAIAAPNNSAVASWDPTGGAAGYNLYRAAAGRFNPSTILYIPGTTYQDLSMFDAPGAVPPTVATAGSSVFWRFDTPTYSTVLGTLPGTTVIAVPPPPGGGTGSGATSTGVPGLTPQGGIVGGMSPVPLLVPYSGSMMLALGNGYPPQYYTDGGSLQPIPNTFQAEYPDWEPSVVWNTGDNIVDSVSGGVFTCTQSGESGTSRPPFNNTLNGGTADNTVVWKCTSTTSNGQALRGAAQMIAYGGSIWIANTYPTTTDDQQDGPNCVRMCDTNDFKSWNPVNVAMISKDDGDEITGLATFTIAEAGIEPTGNLIIFKNFATYQITGVFGSSDFAVQQAQTDLGCVASRTIQFLAGFGAIARLTHLGFSMFNGVGDKVFSEEIRPYLFGDPAQPDIVGVDWSYIYFSKASQSSNPPMYLCACPVLPVILNNVTIAGGSAGTAFKYYVKVVKLIDTGNGEYEEVAITNEAAVQSNDASIRVTTPGAVVGVKYRAYVGTNSNQENIYAEAASFTGAEIPIAGMSTGTPALGTGALTRIFAYDLVQKSWAVIDIPFPISAIKQIRTGGTQPLTVVGDWSDAALRRIFAGDTTWDGADISWSFTTAEIFQEGGSGKVFYRKLVVRGSALVNLAIKAAVSISGNTGKTVTATKTVLGPLQWDARVDIMADGENANATVSGSGQTTIDSLDWYVKPKTPGAPVSAQR